MALRYYRRLRMQSVSKTIAAVSNMRKLRTHIRALATGTLSGHSNPYPPSFSRAEEIRFCSELTGHTAAEIEDTFIELESDAPFLADLRQRYRRSRPEWPHGLHIGRFKVWYALCRLRRPNVVMETGVHDGLSSAIILCALARNQAGRLISIDLPSTDLPVGVDGPGWLVPSDLKARWALCLGDSRALLPSLAQQHAPIDLFIHDSDHTPSHREFEYRAIRPFLGPGGILLTDSDMDTMLDALAAEWSATRSKTQSTGAPHNTYIGGLRFNALVC